MIERILFSKPRTSDKVRGKDDDWGGQLNTKN
jgi:hypothetical protein